VTPEEKGSLKMRSPPPRRSLLLASLACALAACAGALSSTPAPPLLREELDADVAVFGATVCGVAACVAAARMNASCALVEPSAHVGGMTAGGLSGVDLRMDLGGIAREVFGAAHFPNVEPHVLGARLAALLAGAGPGGLALRASAGALASAECAGGPCAAGDGRPLARMSFAGGLSVSARYFIDCSYEGDLLRASGTPWVVGREAAADFNESLAGVSGGRGWGRQLAVYAGVSPWADAQNTSLLPSVAPPPAAAPGDGDDLVMAMNYRLTLTDNASNSRPFAAPAGYDPASMEVLRRWFRAAGANANASSLSHLFLLRQLPGSKIDVNQLAMPMGSDMPFLQRAYPLGNATMRAAVVAGHEWWTRAAWEFLRSDAAVPAALRTEVARWALPLDEFEATGGFPPQLYVRESVRMRGAVVLTQHDVVGAAVGTSNASIGLSQWCVDVHAEQRVALPPALTGRDWEVADVGGVNTCSGDPMPWQLTEVPYGALTPARSDTPNLLVPVCASMTHIAFATYRLEAQYAVHGQSAAVAAVIALRGGGKGGRGGEGMAERGVAVRGVRGGGVALQGVAVRGAGVAVQDVDVGALQAELRAQGQLIDAQPGPAAGGLALAPCAAAPSQAWRVNATDFSLRADGGALCASVFAYSKVAGAAIWGAPCHTDSPSQPANQAWELIQAPGGVRVRSRLSGLCVAAAAVAKATLSQQACNADGTVWSAPPGEPAAGPWAPADVPALCVACAG